MTTAPAQSAVSPAQRMEELARIILAYSEVTERLQQSHDRLEQTVQSLRAELEGKNRLLERRNRLAALGEMAAGMAHEIRNPLGGIQLYASMLARDLADRPASAELVGKIAGGVKRLESLVSQVLQFTREIRAARQRVDAAMVIAQAADLARGHRAAADAKIEVCGPVSLQAWIDPVLIEQAVLNLLINAAEAMSKGGTVRVEYSADESRLLLAVEDEGPGLSAQVMDRLFNPFFTTKESGTGLGLAIVHRIVEAHDGTITARNVERGGARFEVAIPIRPPEAGS